MKVESVMPYTAVILTALAAAIGVIMATIRWRDKRPSLAFVVAHVVLAVTGLALLIAALTRDELPRLGLYSAVAFCAAALGGLVLLLPARLRGAMPKKLHIAGHGLIAVSAFVLLLLAVFG
jgi:peptidoglycan/LPS O-acetylase OafA/YrhL